MKRHLFLGAIVGVVTLGLGYWMGREEALAAQVVAQPPPVAPLPVASKAREAFGILIAKSPEEISQIDLATLSLSCLGGLPDTDGIDLDQARDRIDKLAALVKEKTTAAVTANQNGNPNFKDNPEFRALMLVGTLQDDFNYAHETLQTSAIPKPPMDDQGKSRPEEMFFHGGADQADGTTINNPILFVSVGQRLGYPLKLVAASGHLFARWDDGKSRFNIEEKAENAGVPTKPNEDDPIVRAKKIELEERLADFIITRTDISSEEVASFIGGKSRLFNAHEALEVGLVTQVARGRQVMKKIISEPQNQGDLPFKSA